MLGAGKEGMILAVGAHLNLPEKEEEHLNVEDMIVLQRPVGLLTDHWKDRLRGLLSHLLSCKTCSLNLASFTKDCRKSTLGAERPDV